ncbi:EamA family transporter [Paenibacillus terreus]|uniref:EamA family transporter n=1 Tax=Paenibacillus terreus TaxID=1387834 RepID=A0ABV5BIN6_9BACL
MLLLLLFLAMVFNIIAQVSLKHGINVLNLSGLNMQTLFKVALSPYIWSGAILYGVSFVFYIFALSRGELGRVSPVSQALTTLGIVTVSILIFHEPITSFKIIGIVLLVAGTVIIFY